MRHLKRIRITNDIQLLALPLYNKKTNEPREFKCFIYKSDERVLSDLIYSFKDFKEFAKPLMDDLMAETHYKAVLEMITLTTKQLAQLQKIKNLDDKIKFTKKFK